MKMATVGQCVVAVPRAAGLKSLNNHGQSCWSDSEESVASITSTTKSQITLTSTSTSSRSTTTTCTGSQTSTGTNDAASFLQNRDQPAEVERTADAMVQLSLGAQKALYELAERYTDTIFNHGKPNHAPATCNEALFEEKYDKPDNSVTIPRDFFPSSGTAKALRDCAVRHCRNLNKPGSADNMYALIHELRIQVKAKARADVAIQVCSRRTQVFVSILQTESFRLLFSTPMTSEKQKLRFQGRIGWRSTKKIFLKPGLEATLTQSLSRRSTGFSFTPSLQR